MAVVALAGFGGYVYWEKSQARAEQQTRNTLPTLATEQVPQIFGFDYQTVERSLDTAALLLTDDYRAEFENRAQNEIIPQARDRQLVTQANVVGAGMLDARRDSGSVLVFLNRTVTDKTKQAGVRRQQAARRLRQAARRVEDQVHPADLGDAEFAKRGGVLGAGRLERFEERPGPAVDVVRQHLPP